MREHHVLLVLGDYQPAAHQGVAVYAAKHWWQLEVAGLHGLGIPRKWEGDGVIVSFNGRADVQQLVKDALRKKIPVVSLDRGFPELKMPRVVGDHVAIGKLAAEHLLERGYRRFAWYCEKPGVTGELRFQGYEAVLRAAGHTVATLVPQPCPLKPGKELLSLEAQLKRACADGPLAVFTFNDAQASIVMHAGLRAGLRVPEDMALLGVDDDPLAGGALPIPLSSVRHDLEGLGSGAAKLLGACMDGEKRVPVESVECVPPLGISMRRSTAGIVHSDSKIALAEAFLKTHMGDKINLEDVARAAGLSTRSVDRLFRATFGHSVHDELQRLRIRQAVGLLENTSQPVKAVAQKCGFCTHAYLTYALRRAIGKTPTEIRRAKK